MMKRKPSYNTLIILFFVYAILYVVGCDITQPTEGIRAILNTKERNTTVSVIFRDSRTNEPVGFAGETVVSVQLSGRDSDKVIDLLNRPRSEFDATRGFLSFAVIDDITPEAASPIRFTIRAQADGYLSVSQPVVITESSNSPINIRMVNVADLPSGVAGQVNKPVGRADNGITGQVIRFGTTSSEPDIARSHYRRSGTHTMSSPPQPPWGGDVQPEREGIDVFIEEGTQLSDQYGESLDGMLTASFHYYSPSDVEALQSFPGGLSAEVAGLSAGLDSDGVFFTPGGFVSIEIRDVSGRIASDIEPPFQLRFTLDDQATDHDGEPVRADSSVPVWSYGEELGIWTYLDEIVIEEASNNLLAARYSVSESVWLAIAWHGPRCREGVRVNLTGSRSQMRGKFRRSDNGQFLSWQDSKVGADGVNYITFNGAPQGVAATLELYDMTGALVETADLPDLCSPSTAEVAIDASSAITVTFKGVGVCPGQGDIEVRPNFPMFYKPGGSGQWLVAGNVTNGEIELTVPSAGIYQVGVNWDGEWYEFTLDLSGSGDGDVIEEIIDLPAEVCDGL